MLTSDGIELFVAESGAPDAGVTVLLLHGWTEDHTVWNRVVSALGRQVRVLALDFRGHGGSQPAPRGAATIDRLADDVAELIADRIPTGSVVLAGHSLGGMTMMALAERHPELIRDRVTGAVFVATSSGAMTDVLSRLPAPLAWAAALRSRRSAARRKAAGAAAGASRADAGAGSRGSGGSTRPPRPAGSGGSPRSQGALPVRSRLVSGYVVRWAVFGDRAKFGDIRAAVEQAARAHRGSAAGLSSSISEHDRKAALNVYREVPSVVLVGERDVLTPPEHARLIAGELPGAEFVLYPKAGHMLPYERTLEVAEHIRRLAKAELAKG